MTFMLSYACSGLKKFEKLVESREEEKAWTKLAVPHREGTDSFHLKKMMKLVFTETLTSLLLLLWQPYSNTSHCMSLSVPGNQTS